MFRFQKRYFTLVVILFFVEVLIALYMHDAIIRPYGGDYLVVMLLYSFIMTFIDAPVRTVAYGVLLFAYVLETLQYFNLVTLLGLQDNKIASTVIGTGFAWTDLLAYTLGVLSIVWFENRNRNNHD